MRSLEGRSVHVRSNGALTPAITVIASGSYTVIATDANGCVSLASAPVVVTVNPTPVATIAAGGATTFCDGGSGELKSTRGNTTHPINTAPTPSFTQQTTRMCHGISTEANSC